MIEYWNQTLQKKIEDGIKAQNGNLKKGWVVKDPDGGVKWLDYFLEVVVVPSHEIFRNSWITNKRFPSQMKETKLIVKAEKGKQGTLRFRDYKKLLYLEALWLMESGRPNFLMNDEGYRRVKNFFDSKCQNCGRHAVDRAQKIIYGFCLYRLRSKLKRAAEYFDNQQYITIQGDAWSNQAHIHVYGISIAFYDVEESRVCTVVLYCAPLYEGKAADKLEPIITSVVELMGIEKRHMLLCVSDDEGCVRNSFKNTFPKAVYYTCMAHKIQTCLKHALGLKKYSTDGFPEGEEFFNRERGLVSHFTISPQRTTKLKRIQEQEYKKQNKGKPLTRKSKRKYFVGMTKFSETRWAAALAVNKRLLRLRPHIKQYVF